MGFLDKLLGREKKTPDDTAGDPEMSREGMQQEQEGAAEERAPMQEPAPGAPERDS